MKHVDLKDQNNNSSLAHLCKRYYDYQSEWAGEFTMTPLSVVVLNTTQVEIRYHHVGQYEDDDYRRFVLSYRDQQWMVEGMLGYRSGLYAMESKENVIATDALRFSILQPRRRTKKARTARRVLRDVLGKVGNTIQRLW